MQESLGKTSALMRSVPPRSGLSTSLRIAVVDFWFCGLNVLIIRPVGNRNEPLLGLKKTKAAKRPTWRLREIEPGKLGSQLLLIANHLWRRFAHFQLGAHFL
jgi:hypothetical protein